MVWLLLTLGGCATVVPPTGAPATALPSPTPPPSPAAPAPERARGWWYACSQFNWSSDSEPDWGLDLFVADRVVRPLIAAHRDQLPLWRVHRRAAPDGAGHRFCLIFYATPQVAEQINQEWNTNPQLQRLQEGGQLRAIQLDDPTRNSRPALADASDPAWPAVIGNAWPYYIMGASQMWLELITQMRSERGSPDTTELAQQLEQYRQLQGQISQLWNDSGQHAFLHHLNALFGYQPVLIREQRSYRF
jgi:hypothetical protein